MKTGMKIGLMVGALIAGMVSLMPLTTYAVSKEGSMTVVVSDNITIDTVSNAEILTDPSRIATDNFQVKVTTNKAYTILLRSAQPSLTASGIEENIPATSTLTAGTNGWAIQTADDSYVAVTTSNEEFYSSSVGTSEDGVTTDFAVHVAVSPTLPAATYSTQLIVTAANV